MSEGRGTLENYQEIFAWRYGKWKKGGKPFWQTAVPRWFFPVFFWFTRSAEFQLNKRNSAVRHKNRRPRNEFICLENNIFNTRVSRQFLNIRRASFKRHCRGRQSYGHTQVTEFTGRNTRTEKSIPTSGVGYEGLRTKHHLYIRIRRVIFISIFFPYTYRARLLIVYIHASRFSVCLMNRIFSKLKVLYSAGSFRLKINTLTYWYHWFCVWITR